MTDDKKKETNEEEDKVVDVHIEEEDGRPLATVTRESGKTGWGKSPFTTQGSIDAAVERSKK